MIDYTLNYSTILWSMEADALDNYLQDVQTSEVDTRKHMGNPEDYQAMVSGHFKHGYDMSGLTKLNWIIIWEVEVKGRVTTNTDKNRAGN